MMLIQNGICQYIFLKTIQFYLENKTCSTIIDIRKTVSWFHVLKNFSGSETSARRASKPFGISFGDRSYIASGLKWFSN